MKWDKSVGDAALRVVLRILPFVPAPEVYDLIRSVERSEEHFDRKIKDAFDGLAKSSELIGDLEVALKEREAKLQSLQAEYERVSGLSKLTQEQANAVASSLEQILGKTAAKERWIAFGINLAAGLVLFFLGVFAADSIKTIAAQLF